MEYEEEQHYDLELDFKTFNSMVKGNKEYPEIESIKFLELDSFKIDFDKIALFKNLKQFIFEEVRSNHWHRWDAWQDLLAYKRENDEYIIHYHDIKRLSDTCSAQYRFIPMKGVLKLKKIEWIDTLVIEKFSDLLKLPNLKYIGTLCVLECNYSVESARINHKAMRIYEALPNIVIDNLEIRFMHGDISFLKYLHPDIESIKIHFAAYINNFDCEFVKKTKKIPRFEVDSFYMIQERYNEEGEDVDKWDILERCKKKIKLPPKDFFPITFIHEYDDAIDREHHNLEYLPIVKSKKIR